MKTQLETVIATWRLQGYKVSQNTVYRIDGEDEVCHLRVTAAQPHQWSDTLNVIAVFRKKDGVSYPQKVLAHHVDRPISIPQYDHRAWDKNNRKFSDLLDFIP